MSTYAAVSEKEAHTVEIHYRNVTAADDQGLGHD